MNLNWSQISDTVTTQLTAFGLKAAGAIAVWIVGRYLIGLAVRLVSAALTRQQVDPTILRYLGNIVTVTLNIILVVAILGYFGVETTSFAALLAAAGIAILLGLIFTRSRTGVTLALVGILLSATMLARRAGVERGLGIVAMLAFVGLWLAIEIGLAPVLARFAELDPLVNTRWSIFGGTLAGAGEFFPFGAGFGTYDEVFRRFQPADVPRFVTHAHNDYAEWLFEGGVLGLLLPLAFLALYLRQWPRVWRSSAPARRWCSFRCREQVPATPSVPMPITTTSPAFSKWRCRSRSRCWWRTCSGAPAAGRGSTTARACAGGSRSGSAARFRSTARRCSPPPAWPSCSGWCSPARAPG